MDVLTDFLIYLHTVKYHLNDFGSLSIHLGISGGGSFNWYSYLEGRLADILMYSENTWGESFNW